MSETYIHIGYSMYKCAELMFPGTIFKLLSGDQENGSVGKRLVVQV